MAETEFTSDWLARAAVGGCVILAVTAVAVRVCREPADRVRIISLGLLGAVLTAIVALVPSLPRWSLGLLPADPVAVAASQAPGSNAIPESTDHPWLHSKRPVARKEPKSDLLQSSQESPPPTESIPEHIFAGATVPETVTSIPSASRWSLSRVVMVAYGTATAGFLVWLLLGLWRLSCLWRRATSASVEARELLREIAGPAADRVQVLLSDEIDAPIAFATWRPVIVLPANAGLAESRETLRYGLAHEWSHIESGDVWRWYLVGLAQVILFYQPLFWWLRRQLRLSQDFLADARTADRATEPVDYAEYLVSLARRRLRIPGFALGITDRPSTLTRRIHMLLLNRRPLARRCRLAWTCSAGVVVLVLLVGLSAVRLTAASPLATETTADDVKKPVEPPKVGETLNYTGQIKDKDTGKPIEGATVTVRRSLLGDPNRDERNPIIEESKHTTDKSGKYAFTIPPKQTAERYLYIELDVEHPDYASQKSFGYALSMIRKNEQLGGRPFFELVELRPAKPVTGVVKTPDGKPAAGIKILAYSVTSKNTDKGFEYGSFVDTRTTAEGSFRLPLTTPGWAVVWVLPEEYVPTTHVLKEKRGDLGTFTLENGQRLKGKLLDAKGQTLAGVIVNAESQDRNEEITQPVADNINRSSVTNEKGEFEMKPLPPGKYKVKPGDYSRDGSLDRKDQKRGQVPGVFIGVKVTLKAGAELEPLEVRAVPHVTIEAQTYDSKGKPTRGHAPFVFGRIDGTFWTGEAKIDSNGKVVALVPHGLEDVQLDLMTNEHGVLRWRKGKEGPLNNNRQVKLGTLNDDVKDIEIIKYTAPILVVKVSTKGGDKPPVKTAVTALFTKEQLAGRYIVSGRESDVNFEKQEDGRFRSMQMRPDHEVAVMAHADGYTAKPVNVSLAEGTTKEIEIVLEKAPSAKDGEKGDETKEKK
jgi:beta-lactamase regulating signal transducer with metallopeptidase domain